MNVNVQETLRGFLTNVGLIFKSVCIIILSSVILNSCSLVKPIEFKKVNSFNVSEKAGKVVVTSNLTLYNPNGFQFVVDNADIDVIAEGVNLGKLQVPKEVIINKRNDFTGDFTVEISLIKLLVAGKNVLPKLKQGNISMELKGYVKAHVLWMNKKFDVNYKEKVSLNN